MATASACDFPVFSAIGVAASAGVAAIPSASSGASKLTSVVNARIELGGGNQGVFLFSPEFNGRYSATLSHWDLGIGLGGLYRKNHWLFGGRVTGSTGFSNLGDGPLWVGGGGLELTLGYSPQSRVPVRWGASSAAWSMLFSVRADAEGRIAVPPPIPSGELYLGCLVGLSANILPGL